MKASFAVLVLICTLLFLPMSGINAQGIQYSKEQIIGKWILKSASFNGHKVPLTREEDRITFMFSQDGKVTLETPERGAEKGEFLIRENKIIDPNVPELLSVDIISLSHDGLILAMQGDRAKVIMKFELDVLK